MNQPIEVRGRIRLKDFDPDYCEGMEKEEAQSMRLKFCQQIGEWQQRLYANATNSLLLILQGMDTSGKDGAGRNVLEFVNPSGVETANFKVPSSEERAHDFLWRVHKVVPRLGNVGVFNRSHYEDVLVVRVMKLVPVKVWQARYEQINAFEKMLGLNRVIVLKFFLHISKEEQAERLRARLSDPAKRWKHCAADVEMRKRWGAFQEAYDDVLNRCSTAHAPWHIIPANRKWYRDYLVAKIVVRALEDLKLKWPVPAEDLSRVKIV